MCGIIGYTGKKQVAPILLDGLSQLEYRGYDSSGIAVFDGEGIIISKAKGRLNRLMEKTDDGKNILGTVGIGHTRWATHGEPSDTNSHPHLSDSGAFAVVHNGIIENYRELRSFLIAKGYEFRSQTDSEVVVQLLEYYYRGDIFDAIRKTVGKLRGSYALGILSKYETNAFYAVRKDSPLVIGIGNGENFIASDAPAVLKYTREFIYPGDNEIAVVTPRKVSLFDLNREPLFYTPQKFEGEISSDDLEGYPNYMLKEIYEQPSAVENTAVKLFKNNEVCLDGLDLTAKALSDIHKIFIIACGSSYHAAVVGKYFIEKHCRLPVETDLASEFRYRSPILDEHALAIFISQSGETADTIAALREAKAQKARTLAIVNVVGSTIAREADNVFFTAAGTERAVATTKGYTTQVVTLQMLGLGIARLKKTITEVVYRKLLGDIFGLPEAMRKVMSDLEPYQKLAATFFNNNNAFFIGRGTDYALALEGALKLKEISYIHAECYAAGELKHGTIALIDENSLVIACATNDELFDKTSSNISEIMSRQKELAREAESKAPASADSASKPRHDGEVIVIAKEGNREVEALSSRIIRLPALSDDVMPCVVAVALQLFAYYMAAERGCDIDKPRSLAKSVTVE